MNQRKTLQPHEIRVIKIERKAILDLTWEILSKIGYEKFRLPSGENSMQRIRMDWCFCPEQCEIILLAHSSAYALNKEAAITYIKNLPIEAIESLFVNENGKDCYHSIQNASLLTVRPNAARAKMCGWGLGDAWEKLRAMGSVRPLKKQEIRVIRLSRQAIQELVWEHFMQTGDEIMEIPEEDSASVIFHMHVEEKLEKLTLYAISLMEASDPVFEKVNTYCDQNICVTTNSLSQKSAKERCYVSVLLSKP